MDVYPGKTASPRGGILTMGVFDGVHKGHQLLLNICAEWAAQLNTFTEVWLFHPHPRTVLRGENVPMLTTIEERFALLQNGGTTVVRLIPFTTALSRLSAEAFITEWIKAVSDPQGVVLGYDHRFGYNREGGPTLLREKGFMVKEVQALEWEGAPVSSSRVRRLLAEGAVQAAKILLGYPFSIRGTVRAGRQEARRLGVPTANIPYPAEKIRLPPGIYIGWTQIAPAVSLPITKGLPSLIYLPPVGDLEIHLLGEKQDESLYGVDLAVGIIQFIRPHKEFDSSYALLQQIHEDVAEALRYFSSPDLLDSQIG
ncbi:MAG: riboflavin biosynthesis protein RibF [Bacteroidia bacterium]|nr:riboflavin biosynthesis protein RibF [Bacteroidia bacterium]